MTSLPVPPATGGDRRTSLRAARRRPRVAVHRAALLLLTFSMLAGIVGPAANALAFLLLVAVALILFLTSPAASPRHWTTVLVAAALVFWLGGLALHPNVPDLATAAVGFRKSATILLAVVLGACWPEEERRQATHFTVGLLAAGCVGSLALHWFAPDLELTIIDRAADFWTYTFGGETRAQGIFAGPFHLAMAGSAVLLMGLARILRFPRLWTGWALIGIGAVVLSEAAVRSGILTAAAGSLFLLARNGLRAHPQIRRRIAVGLALSTIVAVVALALQPTQPIEPVDRTTALSSVLSLELDQRAAGRFETWQQAVEMTASSPLVGWGLGSAADTEGFRFERGSHVTSHNLLLRYGVEAGVIGLALFAFVWWRVGAAAWRDEGDEPLIGFLVVSGFGVGGSAGEAIPVSLLLVALAAFGLRARDPAGRPPARTTPGLASGH
jgi:O-antigen ligase